MPSWAVTGQRVVCIEDMIDAFSSEAEPLPKKGEEFVIRDVGVHPRYPEEIGLSFVERHENSFYNIMFFQPVTETKTTQEQDVSLFLGLLNKETIDA